MSEAPEVDQPWLGLLPYGEEDSAIFHGRGRETRELSRLIKRETLTVVFGRSGTGKSSLLNAGVFPNLRKEHFLPIWIRLNHYDAGGHDRQICLAIDRAVESSNLEHEFLNEPLGEGAESAWEYLHRSEFWNERNQPVIPVLVFDQFEELFTLGGDRPGDLALVEELSDLVENYIPREIRELVVSEKARLPACYSEQRYKIVITLREDFVARLDGMRRAMPSVMHNRFYLDQMDGEQALEVVLAPGKALVDEKVGHEIVHFVSSNKSGAGRKDGEAVELSLAELRVEPALLSLVCRELNQRRIREGNQKITTDQVRRSRDDILENFYEGCLDGLDSNDRIFIEDRLVTASGFRSTVPVEDAEIAGLDSDEIEVLVNRRLIRREDRLGTPHIELTHDVLTGVVARSRNSRKKLEDIAEEQRLREQEAKEERRQQDLIRAKRARYFFTFVSLVISVLAVGLALSRKKVREEKQLAEGRSLALNSIEAVGDNQELGLLLAIEAAMIEFKHGDSGNVSPEIMSALQTAIRESWIRKRFEGHYSDVYSVDFHPEGKLLLTGSSWRDASARIWTLDGSEVASVEHQYIPNTDGKKTTVSCAKFSPDGKLFVTATYRNGGYAHVWDTEKLLAWERRGIENELENQIANLSVSLGLHRDELEGQNYSDLERIRTLFVESKNELTSELEQKIEALAINLGLKPDNLLSNVLPKFNEIAASLEAERKKKIKNCLVSTFEGHQGKNSWVTSASFSPDGQIIATGAQDDLVRLWDPTSGQELATSPLAGHGDRVRCVKFNRDGTKLISASDDGTAIIWSLLTDVGEDSGNAESSEPVFIQQWVLDPFSRKKQTMNGCCFNTTGDLVGTVDNDNYLRIWDVNTGKIVAQHRHLAIPMALEFLDAENLVTVCNDSTLRFWEIGYPSGIEKGIPVRSLELTGAQKGHKGQIRSVASSPDRKFVVTGGGDGTARLWERPPNGEVAILHSSKGADEESASRLTGYLLADIFQYPDAPRLRAITGNHWGKVECWDVYGGVKIPDWGPNDSEVVTHSSPIRALSISPDGKKFVTSSSDQTAIVWDAMNGKPLFLLNGHKAIAGDSSTGGTVYQARFNSLSNRVITASFDGTARVWDIDQKAGGKPVVLMEAETLLIPGSRRIKIAEKDLKEFVDVLEKRESDIARVLWEDFFSQREKDQLTGEGDSNSKLKILEDRLNKCLEVDWGIEVTDGNRYRTRHLDRAAKSSRDWMQIFNRHLLEDAFPDFIQRGNPQVYDARFSSDGTRIVTADFDANTATVWDAVNGEKLATFPGNSDWKLGHSDGVVSAAFSPDGSEVVTASTDGYCRVWNVANRKLVRTIPHESPVRSAQFGSEGNTILTGASDGTTRIWNHPDSSLKLLRRDHSNSVLQARFRKGVGVKDAYIISESSDGTAFVSFVDAGETYKWANTRVTRKLSLEERERFRVSRLLELHELDDYRKTKKDRDKLEYYLENNGKLDGYRPSQSQIR